ncbi:hypothetical protein FRC12_010313 [Ceratobasidium sp. 428]|nr:hypothetical protein FRC12_010313 [Ceratobasidium sp. 428]
MPPRRKNKFYPAPSSRATRSHTATTASREAASPSAGTQPALSDIAGEDRGVQLDALVESEGDTDGSERANHHAGTAAGGLYNSDGHRLTIVLPGNGSTLESNENESVLVPVPSSTRNRKSVRIAVPESEAKVEDEDEPEAKPTSLKRKRGRPSTKPVVPEAVEDVIDDSDLVVPPKLPCFVQVGDARRRLELDWAADLQDVKYRVSDLTKVLPWDLELAYSNDTMKRSDRCFITDEAELQAMMREADEYVRKNPQRKFGVIYRYLPIFPICQPPPETDRYLPPRCQIYPIIHLDDLLFAPGWVNLPAAEANKLQNVAN